MYTILKFAYLRMGTPCVPQPHPTPPTPSPHTPTTNFPCWTQTLKILQGLYRHQLKKKKKESTYYRFMIKHITDL